jgi:starch synthase
MPLPAAAGARRSVLMIGPEALPFSKTGGLGDVLGALPAAIARLGWDVTLFTPRYRGIDAGEPLDRMGLTVGGHYCDVGLFAVPLEEGVRAVLVDAPAFFDREFLYGIGSDHYGDNPRRFALLVRAALEWTVGQPAAPAIVHAHDWQAALAPVYMRTMYRLNPSLAGARAVLTIHNLAYQGVFDAGWMPQLDLPWDLYTIERLEYYGRMSLLKGGVVFADAITTVSPTYAREIQTPEGGRGFDGILRSRGDRLVGVLNGIDTGEWNPASDPHLPEPFTIDDLSGKRAAKTAVLEHYGLPADEATLDRPLVGMISRMIDQKGLDLIERIASTLPELDATFVVLGTGEPRYQEMWRMLAAFNPDQIGVEIGYDQGLAHLIEAGLDIFLMPSLFEPCGLNQMYSLRYGTVPVVRRVGGLADTVHDYTPGQQDATGFVFDDYSSGALLAAIRRALDTWRGDPAAWRRLQRNGMRQDHSWHRSAREYVKIYANVLSRGTS